MDNKTPEELQSRHSMRVLGGLRSTLYLSIDRLELQYHQMRSAWRGRNQEDGNANAEVVARLDMIAGSTRVATARVLRYLDNKTSYQSPQRPNAALGSNAHINASPQMYQHQAIPSAHRDPPHMQRPPLLDGTAGRAGHMSPNDGQPDQVTRLVTPGQGGKATVQITVPTRPRSMHTTTTATAEVSDQNESEATPISDRPSRRPFSQNVRFESCNHPQDRVVLRRSTHELAGSLREVWH